MSSRSSQVGGGWKHVMGVVAVVGCGFGVGWFLGDDPVPPSSIGTADPQDTSSNHEVAPAAAGQVARPKPTRDVVPPTAVQAADQSSPSNNRRSRDPVARAYDELTHLFALGETDGLVRRVYLLAEGLGEESARVSLLRRIDGETNPFFLSRVLDPLGRALGDPETAAALGKELFDRFLSDYDQSDREQVIRKEALIGFICANDTLRNRHLPELMRIADTAPSIVQQKVVSSLRACSSRPDVTTYLTSILNTNRHEKVRASSIWSLQGTKNPLALEAMMRGLSDPSHEVRAAAIEVCPAPVDPVKRAVFVRELLREYDSLPNARLKDVVIQRVLIMNPAAVVKLLRQKLRSAMKDAERDYYSAIIALADKGVAAAEIVSSTRVLRDRYRYGR